MKPEFILISGVAIAVKRIEYVDFRVDGVAVIHVGANSVTTDKQFEIDALDALLSAAAPRSSEPELELEPVE